MQIASAPTTARAAELPQRITGTIAYFNQTKGFGFVVPDVSAHIAVTPVYIGAKTIVPSLWKTIQPGDHVAFEIQPTLDPKGYRQAANVVEI